jgi:hypothetical protein
MVLSEFGKYALTTLHEWTSILHLASKWSFKSMRSLALQELLPLASPVDKIVLGRKYGFDDWLIPAFVAVCARAEPLSLSEAKLLDVEDVALIFQARERGRGSSMPLATAEAQDAVACVFSSREKIATASTNVEVDESVPCSGYTSIHLDISSARLCTKQTSLEKDSLAGDVEVEDGLMDALGTWSRICSWLGRSHFDPSPDGPYNNHGQSQIFLQFKAECEGLLKYVKDPQLQATSLRHLLSVILQSQNPVKWNDFYTNILKELCEEFSGQKSLFSRLLNEQFLELIRYQCTFENASDPLQCRYWPAQLLNNMADASLLDDTTLRACLSHLLSLPAQPDSGRLSSLCQFLTKHGKSLDREGCRYLMDNALVKLRKHALDWRGQSIRNNVIASAPSPP